MKSLFLSIVWMAWSIVPLSGQNAQLSDGLLFDGEPFLISNPDNPQHLVVVWMGYELGHAIAIHYRVSFDGGDNWTSTSFIPHIAAGYTSADPSMAYDSEGHLFLCYIDYMTDGSAGGVYVYRSDDGGLTWNPPVLAIDVSDDPGEYPLDRPWMAIDKSGAEHDGNIYINTKPAPWEPAPNASYFIRSIDHGESFEDWTYTDAPGWSVGDILAGPMACPAVNTIGELFIAYPGWDLTESLLPRMIVAASTDGGSTFTYSEMTTITDGVEDTLPKLGYSLSTNPVDPNTLHFLFLADWEGDVDVFLFRSLDGGANWIGPERINNDAIGNGIMQDLTWGNFNENGNYLVTWRDRRLSGLPGYMQSTEIYGRVLYTDGNWGDEFILSSMPANHAEVLNGSGNDFMCNAYSNDTIYAVWGDTRDGLLKIWFSKYVVEGALSISELTTSQQLTCFPNPSTGVLLIQSDTQTALNVYSATGQHVTYLAPDIQWDLDISAYPSGMYFVQAANGMRLPFIKN